MVKETRREISAEQMLILTELSIKSSVDDGNDHVSKRVT